MGAFIRTVHRSKSFNLIRRNFISTLEPPQSHALFLICMRQPPRGEDQHATSHNFFKRISEETWKKFHIIFNNSRREREFARNSYNLIEY